jgi:phospholipid transport system transporter-binding protein
VTGNRPSRDAEAIAISDALTFDTVARMLAASESWFRPDAGPLTIDLAGATRVDSAGVALLLEWQERAERAGRKLNFVRAAEQVHQIVQVSGLGKALDLR